MPAHLITPASQQAERKCHVHHPDAMLEIAGMVRLFAADALLSGQDLIFVCIGTDRSTGDALGPLTGTRLTAMRHNRAVYGTLEEPVHAKNLPDTLSSIMARHVDPFIIAIDACLGRLENVGCVTLGRGSLKPGAAVNKDLPAVGQAYITGIVNVGGFMEHMVLQSTRLNLVMKMAETIAHGAAFGLTLAERERTGAL